MKLTDIVSTIQGCFDASYKDFINVIYFDKQSGWEVAVCKDKTEATLINVSKGEILKTIEINTTTHVSKKFNTFEEVAEYVKSQQYMDLDISNFSNRHGECGYIVDMDIPLILSDRQIVKKLLKHLQ